MIFKKKLNSPFGNRSGIVAPATITKYNHYKFPKSQNNKILSPEKCEQIVL